MSKQTKMLKQDILKILAKDVSGGSNTRPPFEDAKRPNTFFGGADNQPYYPLAQEPSPSANPMTPIVPGIVVLEPGQTASKRPTFKDAKTPQTFFGGGKKCKKAKTDAKEVCAEEKKNRKPRAPTPYNLFVKDFFSKNSTATLKKAAAAWKVTKSGAPPPPKPIRPKIKLTTFQDPSPPPSPTLPEPEPAPAPPRLKITKRATKTIKAKKPPPAAPPLRTRD